MATGSLIGCILGGPTSAFASDAPAAATAITVASASTLQSMSLYDVTWRQTGNIVGAVVYDLNGQAICSYQDQHLYDLDGMIVANVGGDGTVTDLNGTVIGYIVPASSPS